MEVGLKGVSPPSLKMMSTTSFPKCRFLSNCISQIRIQNCQQLLGIPAGDHLDYGVIELKRET